MIIETVEIASLSSDPANVRRHSDAQIEKLMAALRRWTQTLPLLADQNNVVRVGNARLEAMRRLGWTHAKIVRLDLPPSEWTALAIADNRLHDDSEFDDAALAAVLASLQTEDPDLAQSAGYSISEIATLIGQSNGEGVSNDPDATWKGMPECESEDQTAFASVKVNFASAADRDAFAQLIGQSITDNTRSVWHPPAPIGRTADKRYADVA
jgi:hypothetical protein